MDVKRKDTGEFAADQFFPVAGSPKCMAARMINFAPEAR